MFTITGLSPEPFARLAGRSDDELATLGAKRYVVDANPGYPERVTLLDAPVGTRLLLVNYEHQPAPTPYRASHAIFVHEGAATQFHGVDVVPPALRSRVLSLRGFDRDGMLVDAELVDGRQTEDGIERLFARRAVAYVHAHFAKFGCYAALVERG